MSRLTDWLAGASDPVRLAKSLQFQPDEWQRRVLRSSAQYIHLVTSRQVGKSTTTALLALHTALYRPGAVVLIFSPTDRQSGELFLKISGFYRALGKPIEAAQENVHMLRLENDSRIISLPASESGVRGFTASMILIDEAGFVPDALFNSVSPMLAVSSGRMVIMGTPAGQRGFFYDTSASARWERYVVPATDCPRISAEFLEAERERLGLAVFEAEYMCSFQSAAGSAFRSDDIAAMFELRDRPLERVSAERQRPSRALRQANRIIARGPRFSPGGDTCRHGNAGRCFECASAQAKSYR